MTRKNGKQLWNRVTFGNNWGSFAIALACPIGRIALSLLLPQTALVAEVPDNPTLISEPGWGQWQPLSEASPVGFSAGFSNLELGGYLDFQNACQQTIGKPETQINYWFRLNRLVEAIGTGTVEYGCWQDGFLFTYISTAIRTDVDRVDCLQVNSDQGNGLVVRDEPTTVSQQLGVIANGNTINPGNFPALIVRRQQRDWLQIEQPISGWVSIGIVPEGFLNLRLCH